jgi:rhodanese-related sulfurtransferase
MKKITSWLLAFLMALTACGFGQNDHVLPAADFEKQLAQKDIQLLDVRSSGEYNSGHIKQSLQADWNNQEQFMERIKYIDKSKPVYVYCLSGGRSAAAANWMRENGYSSVYELQGGIRAWKIALLPLEGNIEAKQLTMDEFHSQIGNKGLVLVDFGAAWCPPCKKMQPVLDQLKMEMAGKFLLVAIDGGTQVGIMKELDLGAIPAFILYKNGQEIWRKQGVVELNELKKEISNN